MKIYNKYYIQMDYFNNYKKCNKFYEIYNKSLKCAEHLKYFKCSSEKYFTLDNRWHNIKGPAYFEHSSNGALSRISYMVNGEMHRINGPAVICYNNGRIFMEFYYIEDVHHRENGPAAIEYYENGNIKREDYHRAIKLHNEDGPAIILYYENGNIKQERYYLYDKIITKKKFYRLRKRTLQK